MHGQAEFLTDGETGGGAARSAPASRAKQGPGLLTRLASVRLTLWLLGLLAVAMAVATLIPQQAPREAYLRVFGSLLGPLIAHTTLHNIYGAWWFVGAFGLLAVNLLACSVQRARRLLRQPAWPPTVTPQQVEARGQQACWRISLDPAAAATQVAQALRHCGYGAVVGPAEGGRPLGIAARRNRLAPWAPVLVHVGMVAILVGAAWGRLPSNTYRAMAALQPGETYTARPPGESFGLRLLDAGSSHDSTGRPTDFWAKAEVLEEGSVVTSGVVRPNHPLRYHGTSIVLQSMMPTGFAVEVSKGDAHAEVPVVLAEEGAVDMMATIRRLQSPPWVVFIHDFRMGPHGPEAKVFIDRSGELSHNWQAVGWVGEGGLDLEGVHFRLRQAGAGAQFALDRDIGVPIVWLGFAVIALGAVLTMGGARRELLAVVAPRGKRSDVHVGGSGAGVRADLDRVLARLRADSGALTEAVPVKEGDTA